MLELIDSDSLRLSQSASPRSLARSTPALHDDKTGIYAVIYQTVYSCGDTSTFKTITLNKRARHSVIEGYY